MRLKHKKASLIVGFFILFSLGLSAQQTKLPYFCSFEEDSDTIGWTFNVHSMATTSTKWHIGNGTHRIGKKGLYVSEDGGLTPSYDETGGGYSIVAYKKFTLEPGTYDLTFDCRIIGEAGGNDAMRVAWMPTTTTPIGTAIGKFPQYSTKYPFVSSDGMEVFEYIGWETIEGTVTTTAASSDYYLAFIWKTNGGSSVFEPGACVDDIQIGKTISETKCHAKPKNLTSNKDAGNLNILWEGNATKYELFYFNTTSEASTFYSPLHTLTSTSYSIPYSSMPEGVYSFRIRSICGNDTSIWVGLSDILHYDPADYCFDFLDLDAPGVVPTVGTFGNPYQNVELRDHGYNSKKSVHTVHYLQDEYDVYTGNQLKKVPEGFVASVRLSNWTEQSSVTSGSITYTYNITSDIGLLLLNYAAVLQYADHHPPKDQTRINIDILDASTNELLSECTTAEFNSAQVAQGDYGLWQEYKVPAGLTELSEPIIWSQWRTVGINVLPYVGRTVKIRLTLRACVADFHFAYAYFTLGCNDGKMQGISCGVKPDTFRLSEGFNYRWYNVKDPSVTLGTDRKFGLDKEDINTYGVEMINTENEDCFYTITATALPRFPVAKASYTILTQDCQNILTFNNESTVKGIWKEIEEETGEKCSQFQWDMGDYGLFENTIPDTIIIPLEGDTFNVSLRAMMDGGCDSIVNYTIEVPAIGDKTATIKQFICDGVSFDVNGKTYDTPGEYTDTLKGFMTTGCDSIIHIHVLPLVIDSTITADTICSDQPIDFFGQEISTSDKYKHYVRTSLGCDSLYYENNAVVLDALNMTLDTEIFTICADELAYPMAYNITNGKASGYQITYSQNALDAGFVNTDTLNIYGDDTAKILLPQMEDPEIYTRPDYYTANVTFFNSHCGNLEFPIDFEVHYPSYVLTQRWNDVIALKNEDYNGGYKFSSYQWYKNEDSIPEQTSSILYLPNDMDFTADYRLKITREDDGVSIFTCPIALTKQAEEMLPIPNITFSDEKINVESSSKGIARVFSSSGALISTFTINDGNNEIDMPQQSGIYFLNVVCDNTISTNKKIIVHSK